MLKWFVDEQVEEEDNALQIVDRLKAIKNAAKGLSMLDQVLGQRK